MYKNVRVKNDQDIVEEIPKKKLLVLVMSFVSMGQNVKWVTAGMAKTFKQPSFVSVEQWPRETFKLFLKQFVRCANRRTVEVPLEVSTKRLCSECFRIYHEVATKSVC